MNARFPLNLLLVDDDDVTSEAVQRSLQRADIPCRIVNAEDGMEALQILQGEHPERSIQRPFVVLLDLNMPRMNGFEFLKKLRSSESLTDLVVFVLTTSDRDEDRTRAYHEHIAGYMVKSSVGPQFVKLAQLLSSYRQSVQLP